MKVSLLHVTVLSIGCTNCKNTVQLIRQVVDEFWISVQLEKIESLPEIVKYKMKSTPAVVIDDRVVHAGGIPPRITDYQSQKQRCVDFDSLSISCSVSDEWSEPWVAIEP